MLESTRWDYLFKTYAQANVPEYDWRWIKAQAWQESLFDPAAVSPAGAVGLMQIMPATGRELRRITGVPGPLTSPTINVLYGTVYMRRMLNIWKWERPPLERLKLAQASYNAGAGNILAAQRLANNALLWADIQPQLHRVTGHHSLETTNYVIRIERWYGILTEGDDG